MSPIQTSNRLLERRAVRAILMRGGDEVLLLRICAPDGSAFWITPGGGIENGEDAVSGLRRELREELGIENCDVGPIVWKRHHTFEWGDRRISQREEYRIVSVPDRFEARMLDAAEAKHVHSLRWWKIDELSRAEERLTPIALSTIVAAYLAEGAPDPVPPEEVLVD